MHTPPSILSSPLPLPVADAAADDPCGAVRGGMRGAVPHREAAFARGVDIDRSVLATDVHLFSASSLSTDRASLVCYRCGEQGHVKSECISWRIRRCVHFDKGYCERTECPFAHGDGQLRTPWALKCVRILKVAKGFVDFGCGSTSHSFRHCPHTSKIDDQRPHVRIWSGHPKARRSPAASCSALAWDGGGRR